MKKKAVVFILAVLSFTCCYPALFILFGSLTGTYEMAENLSGILGDVSGIYAEWNLLPETWSAEAYKQLLLFEPGFFVLFWNSVKITGGVLLGHLCIAVPAAWGFARYEFRFKKLFFTIYIIFMMLPFQVLMLPEYIVLSNMHLLDTLWAVILPGIFSTFPVFIMYNFFRSIPENVIEAGRIDGANELQIFLHIGIPAGLPGITASMVLQFLEYWNLIEQPMVFFDRQEIWPLSLYLPNINLENAGLAFASSFVALIPSFLIFRMGQEYLERGIAATAVKR